MKVPGEVTTEASERLRGCQAKEPEGAHGTQACRLRNQELETRDES